MKLLNYLIILTIIWPTLAIGQASSELDDLLEEMWESAQEIVVVKVVTASKLEASFEEAPGIVSAITRDEFTAMGARTLEDVLEMIPNFVIGRSVFSGFHQTINVRGLKNQFSQGVLILVDGQRLNDAITGGTVTSVPDIPLDNVKQVEVIRGPGSALYGANAFLAVINIITLSGGELDGGTIYHRSGTADGHFTNVEYGRRLKTGFEFSLHGSFTNWNHDDLLQKDYRTWVADTSGTGLPGFNNLKTNRTNSEAVQIAQFGGTIGYRNLVLHFAYDESDNSNNWGAGAPAGYTDEAYRNKFETENLRLAGTYDRKINDYLSVSLLSSFLIHKPKSADNGVNFDDGASPFGPGIDPDQMKDNFFIEEKDSKTINGEVSATWQIDDRQSLITGINYQFDKLNSAILYDQYPDTMVVYGESENIERNIIAGFIQHSLDSKWFNFTSGLRADYYDDFKLTDNARLALVLKPHRAIRIKGLYAQAFRAPSFYEMQIVIPNPDLGPEKSRTYELQVNFAPSSKLLFSATRYAYKITDGIFPTQNAWINIGKTDGTGVELEARYTPSAKMWMFINYAHADVDNQISIYGEGGMPRHTLNCAITYDFFDKLRCNLNGSARFDWVTQRGIFYPTQYLPPGFPDTYAREDLTLDDTFVLSAHVELHDAIPHVTVTFDAVNITAEDEVVCDVNNFVPAGITKNGQQFLAGVRITF